jgi:hypothetical protein
MKELSVFDKHQLNIARKTLKMSDEGARIMGGMTKEEARKIIKKFTGKEPKESMTKAKELLQVIKEAAGKKYKMNKTYETWDEESVEAGETDDKGFEYQDKEFDSLWAMADEIRDAGATEPSDSSAGPRTWYSTVDPEYSRAHIEKGKDTYYSFHPEGLTDEESKELYKLIKMDRKAFSDADPDNQEEEDESPEDRTARIRAEKTKKLPGMESFMEKVKDELNKVIEYDVNELDGVIPTGYYGDIKNILTFLRGNKLDIIASAFIRGVKKGNLDSVYIDSRVGSKPVSSSWSNGKVGKKEFLKALDRLKKVI